MSGHRLRLVDAHGRTLTCAAVLTDMDGTLVDSRRCVDRTWRAWCEKHDLDVAELFRVAPGRCNRDTVRAIAPHLDVEREVAWLVQAEESCRDGLIAIAGAARLLTELPCERWAVVTSAWRRLAAMRLSAAGLPAPDVIVCADDVTRGKPEPDSYLRAAHLLGVEATDCVVLEDAPVGLAAAAAGMPAIGVTATTEVDHPRCLWTVPDLTTLTVHPIAPAIRPTPGARVGDPGTCCAPAPGDAVVQ